MADLTADLGQARERFLALLVDLRPELHRYCARLSGSIVDGEDIVQDALAKAFYAIGMASELPPLRPWLFRIAHNTALDFLKSRGRRMVEARADLDDLPHGDAGADLQAVRAALAQFQELPAVQRSAVILKDVLGHTLEECAETMDTTVPAVKSALVRGRLRLREVMEQGRDGTAASGSGARDADALEGQGPATVRTSDLPQAPRVHAASDRGLLERYVALFNARDWDGLRSLVGEDCRLDLVSKASRRGKSVGEYFGRYARENISLGVVLLEGRDALAAYAGDSRRPAYFVLVAWGDDGKVREIRDYRYVKYIVESADFSVAPDIARTTGRP